MSMEEHFQKEDVVEFAVDGVEGFGYKPVTAGDELSWLPECTIVKEDGRKIQDQGLVTKCKFKNLVNVPYTKEIIKKMIGHDKLWSELGHEERWLLIGKMKPSLFNKLVSEMDSIDKGTYEEQQQKKN